ncbi:MAG: CvpA family protein [Rhizobiales bacterium]|nr:CvpA family protein [Hyphomicrobiales bacterium]
MNIFDIAIYAGLLIAVVGGFHVGLLRSAATIVGYLMAMPVAVWITGLIAPQLLRSAETSLLEGPFLLFIVFVLVGIVFGKLLRMVVDEITGTDVGLLDRLAGALLGAVRLFLVAITLVLIVDQLMPTNRQPAFLNQSSLRPMLSWAAAQGIKSLPPDITAYIDRLKRQYRL